MPEYLSVRDTRYYLVPENDFRPENFGLPHGVRVEGRAFVLPTGDSISHAVPILERDLWLDLGTKLITIEGWACYPFKRAFIESFPRALVEQILDRTQLTETNHLVTAVMNWAGLVQKRSFHVRRLSVGAAIWPPRALRDWTGFYMVLGAGKPEVDAETYFAKGSFTPWLVSLHADRAISGEVRIIAESRAAVLYTNGPPSFIGFSTISGESGLLPVGGTEDGGFQIRRIDDAAHAGFQLAAAAEPPEGVGPPVAVAVDFGTTNTAVAIRIDRDEPKLLEFSPNSRGVNLVHGLDAVRLEGARNAFFPVKNPAPNPLSTLLVDLTGDNVRPFSAAAGLPARVIPFDRFEPGHLQTLISGKRLRQDFKWADSGEEPRAFMEVLGRLVALELRIRPETSRTKAVSVRFTRPLSFSEQQRAQVEAAKAAFESVLQASGHTVVSDPQVPISESLANLRFVQRGHGAGGAAGDRHVIVDIGGGSTDIAVFKAGDDHLHTALHLDSLRVGGRHFIQKIVRGRAADTTRLGQVLGFDKQPIRFDHADWGGFYEQLFVSQLSQRGVEQVAESLGGPPWRGAMLDLLTLLTTVTTYAIRLATAGHATPGTIQVWFSGQGAELFRLIPLPALAKSRLAVAEDVLRSAGKHFTDAELTFDWRSAGGKLAVCKGALLVEPDVAAQRHSSVVWASIPGTTDGDGAKGHNLLDWDAAYTGLHSLTPMESQWDRLKLDAFYECLEMSATAVAEHLDEGHAGTIPPTLRRAFTNEYVRRAKQILNKERDAPHHPIRGATDVLLDSLGGIFR